MAVTAKAKSAIHHVTMMMGDPDKMQLRILQAKSNLKKDDHASKTAVDAIGVAYGDFLTAIAKAEQIITEENQSQPQQGKFDA